MSGRKLYQQMRSILRGDGIVRLIERRLYPLTTLIAWLSVCIIAAAWALSPAHPAALLWKQLGTFGLLVSYGLDITDRFHVSWIARRVRKALETKPVTKLSGRPRDSVHLLCKRLEQRKTKRDRVRGPGGEYENRLVRITPIKYGRTPCEEAPVRAYVRDVSDTGIGLTHDDLLPSGFGLLEFESDDSRWCSILVEIRWSKPARNGRHHSGCEFVGDGAEAAEGLGIMRLQPSESLRTTTTAADMAVSR